MSAARTITVRLTDRQFERLHDAIGYWETVLDDRQTDGDRSAAGEQRALANARDALLRAWKAARA